MPIFSHKYNKCLLVSTAVNFVLGYNYIFGGVNWLVKTGWDENMFIISLFLYKDCYFHFVFLNINKWVASFIIQTFINILISIFQFFIQCQSTICQLFAWLYIYRKVMIKIKLNKMKTNKY